MTNTTAALRVHRLSDAAFVALGAGRPDAATLEELRRAQLSRHLLLLRELVAAVPVPGYAALAAAERANPAEVRALLARPLIGVWAARWLAALRSGTPADEAPSDYLAALAARAALVPDAEHPPEPERMLTATHDGLSISVRLEDRDPLRAGLGLNPAPPLTDTGHGRWQRLMTDAWRQLVAQDRPDAEVLATVLDCIVPVEPDPAARGISATSADAYGAVAMSEPADATGLAVGLLHETRHSLLNAVQYLFDLHDQPDALGYSPWRDDPRPAAGILHGAYAYLTVTRFWRARSADRLAAFEFARWRAAVLSAADGLLAGGTLTPAGTRFVTALRAEVRPWLDEPVPPDVARLAAGANVDHHVRWRLRNLHVAPQDAGLLADAWSQGRNAPRIGSRLRPAPRRALEASDRLDLVHATLRAEPAPKVVAAGDLAHMHGDAAAALRAYRKRVALDPRDDAAWAGLALSGGPAALRDTPEMVATLYRTLGDPDADPLALAAWLSC
jgi:hypothetical protein